MGSGGSESRNDDSQASLLLAAALRPRDLQPNSPAPDEPHVSDGSLHSSGHSVHYHMNGLMPTQTQSLYNSQDPTFDEGSQKENAPAPPERRPHSPVASQDGSPRRTQAGSYPSPPSDNVVVAAVTDPKDKTCPKATGLSNNVNKPSSAKGGKAVSFAPPSLPISRPQTTAAQAAATPAKPTPMSRRRRSPSPASQDSFAGPLPERDPVAAYIEQSKAFQIPLSRLVDDSQSLSEGEDGPPPVSNMWANRPRNRATRSPSPPGKVLVEGTPSNSSRSKDSQSQSQSRSVSQAQASQYRDGDSQQSSGDTQSSDFFPPGQAQSAEDFADLMNNASTDTDVDEGDQDSNALPPTQHSDVSTEPSSSYERLVNQDPFSPLPEATQPAHADTSETQPVDYSKPTYERDASSILENHDFYNENGQVVFPSVPSGPRSVRSADTTNSTHSTAPRGLLGLIAPHKRYRYLDIKPSPAPPTQLAHGNAVANTTAGQAEVEETQVLDNSAAMISVTTEETQVVDNSAPMISVTTNPTQPSHESVVPESVEPMLPRRTLPTATRKLQSLRARRPSPRSEIVPDSEETRIVPDSDPPMSPPAGPPTAQSSPVKPRSRRGLQSEDEVLRAVTREVTAPSVETVQEEEENDDDEEEDVPLAATVPSAKAKGKWKAVEAESPKSPKKAALIRDSGPAQKSTSWRDAVIPSSDPQERYQDAEVQPKTAKPKTPEAQIAPPPQKTRSAPRQAKTAAKGRLHESSDDEDEDAVIPDADDDDGDTVPADDQMDVDQPGPSSRPARGGKRKRTISSSARKNSSGRTPKQEFATPATRPTKRLKSGSSARISYSTATRVIALWRKDGHYYAGTVHEQLTPGLYQINFDDGDSAPLELRFLRACRFRAGDNVLIAPKTRARVVAAPPCGATGHQAEDALTLDLDEDGEERVKVQTLRLASRTVGAEWGDRVLTDDAISPAVQPKTPPAQNATPAPSEGSARPSRKLPLHKTGLVITSSPSNLGPTREALIADIRRNGGVVLDDWSALFAMDGTVGQKGQRWVLRKEDVKWRERADIEKAFLISDDNHQKPKFLIALALGIPCLSVEWVTNCIREEEELDWQPYLLPAGFSDHLSTRVSQLVDLDWGNSTQYLTGITENLVPARVFSEKKILCIGPEFMPCRGKGKKTKEWGKAEAVPQIILCMGAETVEAVPDEKHASQKLDNYDYIVIREKTDGARFRNVPNCVDVNWVKSCLISGRLFPTSST